MLNSFQHLIPSQPFKKEIQNQFRYNTRRQDRYPIPSHTFAATAPEILLSSFDVWQIT